MASRADLSHYRTLADLQGVQEEFREQSENSRYQVIAALIAAVVLQIIAGFTMAFPGQCLRSVPMFCGFCTVGNLVALSLVGLCFSEYVKTHAGQKQFYYQLLAEKLTG